MKTGRIVLITGGAGGIGAALVARFLANDDRVIVADRDEAALARLASACHAPALTTVLADVADEASCAALAARVTHDGGRLDVLVHCAGYFPLHPFEEMTVAQWQEVIAINLSGPFLVTRALLPLMKGRGWGRIVCMGSASVFEGVPAQVHYVAAKAGVVGFARSLAREVGGDGITVNVVAPGLTLTPPVREGIPPELVAEQRGLRALGRDETPEDLAGAVFFLASPEADFITGRTINVDGGKSMP